MRTSLRAQAVLLLAVLAWAACTEEPFSPSERGSAPGASVETREVTVPADAFDVWRDTTYTGYAIPVDASFRLVGLTPGFESRVLARFPDLPDSVSFDGAQTAVDSFPGGELQVVLDTARSRVPGTPVTIRLYALERAFDTEEATWTQADSVNSWSTPGGDLGTELGSLTLEGASDSVLADTLRIPLPAGTDSVLRAWRESEGEPGSALLVEGVEGSDVRLQIRSFRLAAEAALAGEDTTIRVLDGGAVGLVPSTFIYDPPPSDAGTNLRLGGLPAHRFYFVFEPPDSAEGVSLRGGTINRAEFVFPSRAPPPEPYRFAGEVRVGAFELTTDPFVAGPKTPVGAVRTGDIFFDPTGGEDPDFRLPVTALIRTWAAAPPDSLGAFRLGVALRPDAQAFGHWDLGSVESSSGRRPFLRLLVTPPASFDVP